MDFADKQAQLWAPHSSNLSCWLGANLEITYSIWTMQELAGSSTGMIPKFTLCGHGSCSLGGSHLILPLRKIDASIGFSLYDSSELLKDTSKISACFMGSNVSWFIVCLSCAWFPI